MVLPVDAPGTRTVVPYLIPEPFNLEHKVISFLGIHFVVPILVGVGVGFLFRLVTKPIITIVDEVI